MKEGGAGIGNFNSLGYLEMIGDIFDSKELLNWSLER